MQKMRGGENKKQKKNIIRPAETTQNLVQNICA